MGYVWGTPQTRTIILLTLWLGVFAINWHTLVPAYALLVLHLGAGGYGLMLSSVGIGGLCGSIVMGLSDRTNFRHMLAGGWMIGCVYLALTVPLPSEAVAGVLAVAGFATAITLTSANTSLQAMAPGHLRGRVMSVYLMVVLGSNPLGGYLTGWAFEYIGGRVACGLLSVVTLAGLIVLAIRNWPLVHGVSQEPKKAE